MYKIQWCSTLIILCLFLVAGLLISISILETSNLGQKQIGNIQEYQVGSTFYIIHKPYWALSQANHVNKLIMLSIFCKILILLHSLLALLRRSLKMQQQLLSENQFIFLQNIQERNFSWVEIHILWHLKTMMTLPKSNISCSLRRLQPQSPYCKHLGGQISSCPCCFCCMFSLCNAIRRM